MFAIETISQLCHVCPVTMHYIELSSEMYYLQPCCQCCQSSVYYVHGSAAKVSGIIHVNSKIVLTSFPFISSLDSCYCCKLGSIFQQSRSRFLFGFATPDSIVLSVRSLLTLNEG